VAAPEKGWPGEPEAIAYTQARVAGRSVIICLEPTQTRDAAGHLLAYAYLSDSDDLNFDVIRDGKAYADRRIKHTFASMFEQAENDARRKSRGLWDGLRLQDQPNWRQTWLKAYLAERHAMKK
jgi:endonuclease YncB( thermonuclease family)